MRRNVLIVALVLFAFAFGAYADEAVLIDFNLLHPDTAEDPDTGAFEQNSQTQMDFGATAGDSYTEDQKAMMMTSLAVENWEIILASSSRTPARQALCDVREALVSESSPDKSVAGKYVLAVRINFPLEPFNSWARIIPPFKVPAYVKYGEDEEAPKSADGLDLTKFEGTYDETSKRLIAYGIVKNVGVIKQVAVKVKGLNFPHGLTIVLTDNDGNEKFLFMGYLNFDGWKDLKWTNPAYIQDVKNRELRLFPLYPRDTPYVRFDSFIFTRDAMHEGGDFICYIKDVRIIYDRAILDPLRDINDEEVWGILTEREKQRMMEESRRFGQRQVLRYLEEQKQDESEGFYEEEE
jgi:hypothetical protein